MAVVTTITITHDKEVNADIQNLLKLPTFHPRKEAEVLINYLNALQGGVRMASVDLQVDGGDAVAASGTVAFSGAATANDTFLVNGVTFTAVASGATGNQFNVGANATASGANLAAAINASATALVSGQVSAASVTGTVTITALLKGVSGNAITIAKNVDAGPVMTVSGARLTGGTNATANAYKFGV